jgi:hypothetical protein
MGLVDGIKQVFSPPAMEPPLFPQPQPEFQPMYASWEAEDMTGTAGIALDNSSLLIQIQSFLSGTEPVEVTDKTGKKKFVWQQIAEPKMNKKGVNSIVLELRARLDKNTIMTFIPNYDELMKFMEYFSVNFALFIAQNTDEFDIKDNYQSQVCDFIVDQVYITLLRGLEGNEKQGIYKQVRRIEHSQTALNSPQMMQKIPSGGIFK